ncbi:peroxiredoxin [Ruania albidiflava]|uniref:peroxiredoxin n=1 Tax=Ruania albidiflava TaxID=366586 RepID=UPI0003B55337|nr:peroxiredoxin [Ruania albidiflava]
MSELAAGATAPDFTLTAHTGDEVSLTSALASAEQGVIVYFYPKAATPGCTTEACDFRDSLSSLAAAGYAVVGISPDPIPDLQAFAEAESLTFPLASDTDHAVADAYGAWGLRPGRTVESVRRSTFVVNPDGTLRSAEYDVDATGHVARLRAELLGS